MSKAPWFVAATAVSVVIAIIAGQHIIDQQQEQMAVTAAIARQRVATAIPTAQIGAMPLRPINWTHTPRGTFRNWADVVIPASQDCITAFGTFYWASGVSGNGGGTGTGLDFVNGVKRNCSKAQHLLERTPLPSSRQAKYFLLLASYLSNLAIDAQTSLQEQQASEKVPIHYPVSGYMPIAWETWFGAATRDAGRVIGDQIAAKSLLDEINANNSTNYTLSTANYSLPTAIAAPTAAPTAAPSSAIKAESPSIHICTFNHFDATQVQCLQDDQSIQSSDFDRTQLVWPLISIKTDGTTVKILHQDATGR